MPTPHQIAEFLHSPWFEYVTLPLLAAFIMVFVKTQCKRAAPDRFTIQELAIGLDLIFAGVLSFATYAASLSKELLFYQLQHSQRPTPELENLVNWISDKQVGLLYSVFFCTIVLWGLSALVSAFGWKNRHELNNLGIFVPLLASAIPFMILGYYIGN